MARSQQTVTHVVFDLELIRGAHDRHPALHDHDDGHANGLI